MSTTKEPGAFLRTILLRFDRAEHYQWHDRLVKAEREKRILRRAVFLTILLLILSLAGLAYCAVLRPDFLQIPLPLLVRGLVALSLCSFLSQIVFLGYLLRLCAAIARLHEEGRRLVLDVTLRQPETSKSARPAMPFDAVREVR